VPPPWRLAPVGARRVSRVSHLPPYCASLLFAAGKTAKQVQVWLGHTDPAFTLRVNVHLMDDGLGDALDEATWAQRTAPRIAAEQAVGAAKSA
jgi:integrase